MQDRTFSTFIFFASSRKFELLKQVYLNQPNGTEETFLKWYKVYNNSFTNKSLEMKASVFQNKPILVFSVTESGKNKQKQLLDALDKNQHLVRQYVYTATSTL